LASIATYMRGDDARADHGDYHYHPGLPGADGRGLNRAAAARLRAAWRHLPKLSHNPDAGPLRARAILPLRR
jgi:hypothetical protein